MAIQLFVSNDLSKLATQLASDLKESQTGVFSQQQIVTQTEGMNNWLKITLAQELGIAANCAYRKPNDVVSMIYFWLGGFDKPILNTDFVKWNLFHYLNENDFKQKFPFIAHYYQKHEVKRIALATKVADLFDQYQVYRPDAIEAWKHSDPETITDWQEYLWMKLYQQTKENAFDKTDAIRTIISYLSQEEKVKVLKAKLPHLHFFGIAVITPFYLHLFYELSKHIQISFYLLNPAPTTYWLEDKSEKEIARIIHKSKRKVPANTIANSGNELLLSWGNIIRESFSLLFEQDTFINHYDDSLAVDPKPPVNLLQKIQHDIYFNATTDDRNEIQTTDITDGSITINNCYTIVREIEVLYNYLVHLVDQKKEKLSARDIVVMVSDIDNYAPYIRAVFDNAPYHFPYTIADESVASGNSMFTTIQQILNLQPDSFKAEEILELLESPYIRQRFSLRDPESIRKAVDLAGIRFGDTGETANDTHLVSWQYGLQRMLYGICISGEPILDIYGNTIIPLNHFEGGDAYELIRFWNFFKVLEETVKNRIQERSIGEWGNYLQELVENLVFESGDKEDEDYHLLVTYLEKLTLLQEVSNEPISYEVFRHSFLEILNTETKAMSFAGAGITFCSLIPMRSIPFKVVAMLGMNFDKFPRKENKISFSLLEKEKRKGDRNVKDNDKHLFLETLLSARQYFYLSYIGRNVKDATKIPPSSMVDELIAYTVQGCMASEDDIKSKLLTTHPLHGFSQQYFNGSGLYSYLSDEKYANSEKPIKGIKEQITFDFEEIPIKDFLQFIRSPIKWYFNKGLGIYYGDKEMLLPDTEVFELDRLSYWQMNRELLEMPFSEYESYYEYARLQGRLPLKNMGLMVFETTAIEIREKAARLKDITGDLPPQSKAIRLRIGDHLLVGNVGNIYQDKLVWFADTDKYHKYVLEAFLSYLLVIADGQQLEFHFMDFKSGESYRFGAGVLSAEEAKDIIASWLTIYKSGFHAPFLFVPEMKIKFFESDETNYQNELTKTLNDDHDYTFKDEYLKKALELQFFDPSNFEILKSNADILYQPILNLLPGIIK